MAPILGNEVNNAASMCAERRKPGTKFQKALIHWCETDDKCELIRFTLHAYSHPSRNSALRKSLTLEPTEEDEIRRVGLVQVRELLSKYIDSISDSRDTAVDFPIKNALFANGICCRECIGVCHGIPYWKKLVDENKEKFTSLTMKWIHSKVTVVAKPP